MQFLAFNWASEQDAYQFLKQIVAIERWVDEVVSNRPYISVQELLSFAETSCQAWTWRDVKKALDNHPRIGEKKAQTDLTVKEQAFSEREQAKIAMDEKTKARLVAANQRYEQQFGFIFLIKAAGLTSQQILAALEVRLQNNIEQEQKIVMEQLSAITLLRLSQELQA